MSESIFDRVSRQGAYQIGGAIMNKIPEKVQKNLPLAKVLLSGDINKIGAIIADRVLGPDFGLKNIFAPELGVSLERPSQLLGGINMAKAHEIFNQTSAIEYAKKNLWHLQIVDFSPGKENPSNINLFATDVSYAPITISGDAVRVGAGSFDLPQSSERVEMRVTTMDDSRGTLKRWFLERSSIMCRPDGTFGLPLDYLMVVAVTHAYIDPELAWSFDGEPQVHTETYVMRPGGLEYDLSRRDDNMQELQMTFVQFDTFTGLIG